MAGVVTTSLVVSLGEGADVASLYAAEVDSREDGLNGGRTSFNPGDSIYILLFKTDNVTTLHSVASQGSLTYQGTTDFEVEGFAEYPNENESSLSYPVPSGAVVTKQWLGNDLGNSTISNQSSILLSTDEATLGDPYVGILKYSYTAVADIYLLQDTLIPSEPEYSILCFFQGSVA